MAKAKRKAAQAKSTIHRSDVFKLGKGRPRRDKRNLKFAAVLKALPKLPPKYDFDVAHSEIPTPMFANDELGCCVISGRAHQTLRFEDLEQKKVIPISDKDVTREYFKETGGPDSGLIVLDSLNLWRHNGWKVGKRGYKIKAYAEIDRTNRNEVRRAIFSDVGVGIGVDLPRDAKKQIDAGQRWDVTTGPGAKPGSWGGLYVYVSGYTPAGPVCVTWGRKQQMTWAWMNKYCDEAYGIFDAQNKYKTSVVDTKKINAFLKAL